VKTRNDFSTIMVRSSKHLESIITSNIESKSTAHYLIVNSWDKVCKFFNDKLPTDGVTDLYVIDIFNVPNALDVMRSSIKMQRETISTYTLSNYCQLPMMVVIHKMFPRVVTYNGSIFAELNL